MSTLKRACVKLSVSTSITMADGKPKLNQSRGCIVRSQSSRIRDWRMNVPTKTHKVGWNRVD